MERRGGEGGGGVQGLTWRDVLAAWCTYKSSWFNDVLRVHHLSVYSTVYRTIGEVNLGSSTIRCACTCAIYIYIYTHTYIHTRIHMHMHMHIHIHLYSLKAVGEGTHYPL